MGAREKVVFAASFSRVTGDGEQLTVNFNAENAGELATRLKQAIRVADDRMAQHNKKVMDLSHEVQERVEQTRGKIAKQERERLIAAGLLDKTFRDFDPIAAPDPKEENGADAATGSTDLRTDP